MAVTTGDELYQVNVSDGTDTVQHPIKDAKAREDIGGLKSAVGDLFIDSIDTPTVKSSYLSFGGKSIGATLGGIAVGSASWNFYRLQVTAGERYKVTGTGGNDPALWALTDKGTTPDAEPWGSKGCVLLAKGGRNETLTDYIITVAQDGWLLVNQKKADTFSLKHEVPVANQLDELRSRIPSFADFGTAGDGTTDDSDAIQAALDAGGDLYIPAGTYLFSKTLYIKSGTRLYGDGAASVFQLADSFTLTPYAWRTGDPLVADQYRYPMIMIESTESGCMLANFHLKGQTDHFYDKNCDGIAVFGNNHVIDNLIVEDINCFPSDFGSRVNNGVGYGIRLGGSTISVRNCTVVNCGYECIGLEDADTCEVVNCNIGYACQTGLQIHRNCSHIKVTGNNIHAYQPGSNSYRPGITLHASTEHPMSDIVISENYSASSIVFANGDAENNVMIANNRIAANILINDFGNESAYRSNWIITGNWIAGLVQAQCDNLIISNNIIKSNTSASHTMIRALSNKYIIKDNLAIGTYSDVEINGEIVN